MGVDMQFLLNQAYEESRYHRRFHHTIYTLFMTIYISLLGFQFYFGKYILTFEHQGVIVGLFIALFVVIIPTYVSYIIVHYHKRISILNSLIANLAETDDGYKQLRDSDQYKLKDALETLVFHRYKEVASGKKYPMRVGAGHWFFLILFFLIVICNLINILIFVL